LAANTTANFTVHSPLNLLTVHPLSDDMAYAASACLDRQTTGGRGGQTLLLNSACMHLQPRYAVSEFSVPPCNR